MPLGCAGDSCKGCDGFSRGFSGHDGVCKEEPPDERADLQYEQEKHRAVEGLLLCFVAQNDGSGEAAKGSAQGHDAQQAALGEAALVIFGAAFVDPHADEGCGAENGEPVKNEIVVHG